MQRLYVPKTVQISYLAAERVAVSRRGRRPVRGYQRMATRHGTVRPAQQHTKERFLDAALKVLVNDGVNGLTVRGIAEAARASTIAVYTRFGGRSDLLDALYERTFDLLRE